MAPQDKLWKAVLKGDAKGLAQLLDKKAAELDVNARDDYEWTPLAHAAWRGDQRIVRMLVEQADASLDGFYSPPSAGMEPLSGKAAKKAKGTERVSSRWG